MPDDLDRTPASPFAGRVTDLIRPFQIDPFGLRGRLVRLGPAIDTIILRHGYPAPVGMMIGEAMALAALLAGALKYEGVFTLQTKGDGPIRLLVADVTSAGALRAYAQYDEERLPAVVTGAVVPRLLGAGYLAFTVDQGEHTDRYQGIVALEGATLAECAHHYFRQSEQIEAGIMVAARHVEGAGWQAGGLMLQRLPGADLDEPGRRLSVEDEAAAEAEDDGWRHALALLGSTTEQELTDPALAPDDLLYRLFHDDGVRVYPAEAVAEHCRCTRARIEAVLQMLPPAEIETLVQDGEAVVTCEFCSRPYVFTAAELHALGGAA